MKRIVDFIKKKYKILIPIMVVIVLLVTVYFLYREYKYDNYRNKVEETVYQYFGGNRIDYTAIVTYNLKNNIIDVSAKDKKIQYDGTPIYYKDLNKVLFPKEMSIVFPTRDGYQYRLYKYTVYEKDGETNNIYVNAKANSYSYFFLYDGEGVYFFPDEVELSIGSKKINLSPMSYVSTDGGYTLIYYDHDKDVSSVIDLGKETVMVKNDDMEINILENYFLHFGKKVLLFKPYNLDSIEKMN